jgi:hypothetical protein
MMRIKNVTANEGEPRRSLRDEELEAVTGGALRALGGPDTRPDSGADHAWGSYTFVVHQTGRNF